MPKKQSTSRTEEEGRELIALDEMGQYFDGVLNDLRAKNDKMQFIVIGMLRSQPEEDGTATMNSVMGSTIEPDKVMHLLRELVEAEPELRGVDNTFMDGIRKLLSPDMCAKKPH